MSVSFCVLCSEKHEDSAWRFTKVQTSEGETTEGWICSKYFKPRVTDNVPEYVKNERKKYATDLVQSHRQGELSREFVELYPDRVRGMIKEGVVTRDEVKKAKPVWGGDIPGLSGYKPKVKHEKLAKEI